MEMDKHYFKEFDDIEKSLEDIEIPEPSKFHKIEMNRVFREHAGGRFIPYPEVDNFYERLRSRIIVKFNINTERQTKRRQRRRK